MSAIEYRFPGWFWDQADEQWLAHAPDGLPAAASARIAQCGVGVRRQAATRRDCPASLLETWAYDDEWRVRYAVAKNPACPAGSLERLAADVTPDVAKVALRNPSCPTATLTAVASHAHSRRRGSVAASPSCPPALLVSLGRDVHEHVRALAVGNPAYPAELVDEQARKAFPVLRRPEAAGKECRAALENPSCDVRLVARAARSRRVMWREAAAGNLSCPSQLLEELVHDENNLVSFQALKNPSCPFDALPDLSAAISEYRYTQVLAKVNHPACPPEVLGELLDKLDNDSVELRNVVLTHPQCPPDAVAGALIGPGRPIHTLTIAAGALQCREASDEVWEAAGTLLLAGFAGTGHDLLTAASAVFSR